MFWHFIDCLHPKIARIVVYLAIFHMKHISVLVRVRIIKVDILGSELVLSLHMKACTLDGIYNFHRSFYHLEYSEDDEGGLMEFML